MPNRNSIKVFEHTTLRVDDTQGKLGFKKKHLDALARYLESAPVPYYQIMHNGVRFLEYVGVIQAGDLTIEVLPKADRNSGEKEKEKWQKVLFDMLRVCRIIKLKSLSHAHLLLRTNSILDLYIGMFLDEVEVLLHQGLVKRYQRVSGNQKAWKGKMQFQQQIQRNTVHQERFFVECQIYDQQNTYNRILYKAIRLLPRLTMNPLLLDRVANASISFPELTDLSVSESTFSGLVFDRKTERYRQSLDIARLLLLNFHPDIRGGRDHVLALLFDMNVLWEKYLYIQLKKQEDEHFKVQEQVSKPFWRHKTIRPDIVVYMGNQTVVLDAKWKVLDTASPSDADLKQMYVYNQYFEADRSILVYPEVFELKPVVGDFKRGGSSCEVRFLRVLDGKGEGLDLEVAGMLKKVIEEPGIP